MLYRIIRNDIRRSKVITLATMIFIAAAAMLVSLTAVLFVNLSGAIDNLMEQAATPHFMQMHSGEIDAGRLAAFAEMSPLVEEYQVIDFLNVDGADIVLDGTSLAASVQDNGFVTQSSRFDFLLDLDGEIIEVSDGEVYAPLAYLKEGSAAVGDAVAIGGKKFVLAGFLRDSQMNSSLASSKRFLISEPDYSAIRESGSVEYLIEFRLHDIEKLGEFENAYNAAGLEGNGPTITSPLFKLINGISDGLMIAVILLISALMAAISLLCIRFSLLTKIEEEYREIGVMKAMGLPLPDIKRIYLAKYLAVTAAGCILGYLLSFAFKGLLLENIRLFMGESRNAFLEPLFGIIGILIIFLLIILYVNKVLKRIRRISASEAIRFGSAQEKLSAAKRFVLTRNRLLSTNIFLGINDVLSRKKLYATMLSVLVLSTFIMTVPQNLYDTISSESFITYMGVGNCALRLDVQQTDDITEKTGSIRNRLEADETVSRYVLLTTQSFPVKHNGGDLKSLKIEGGDHTLFPVAYSQGRAPVKEGEIALSALNAEELGLGYGDTLTLFIDGEERDHTVCGLYSDITNGGKTAKAVISSNSSPVMWSVFCLDFHDPAVLPEKVSEYAQAFPFAKVSPIEEYIDQTFGSTMSSVQKASLGGILLGLIVSVLVTILFMNMIVAKDRCAVALLKANGFSNSDLICQYAARSLFVLIIGILLGTLLANTLGDLLGTAVISLFGASTFRFEINPLTVYLLFPLLLACAVTGATMVGTRGVKNIRISENIKE